MKIEIFNTDVKDTVKISGEITELYNKIRTGIYCTFPVVWGGERTKRNRPVRIQNPQIIVSAAVSICQKHFHAFIDKYLVREKKF